MNADTLLEQAVERRRANDLAAALALLAEAEARAEEQGRFDVLAQILGESGWILVRTGDLERAIDAYTRAAEAADTADDAIGRAMWLVSLAGTLGNAGRAADARRWLEPMRDAAAATGNAKLMADAVLQSASILSLEKRYAEAMDLFEAAELDGSAEAAGPNWRFNKALTLGKWGAALFDEGQLSEARDVLESAVPLFETVDSEEAGFALSAYIHLIEIAELRNDHEGRRRASRVVAQLARQLGHEEMAVAAEADAADEGAGVHLENREVAARIAGHERELDSALAARDARAETLARTNLAIARLGADEEQAWHDLEPALTAAGTCGDLRSEFWLAVHFAHPAVARGERLRAIQLAERAVRLAQDGSPLQRGLAALVRGSVCLDAMDDSDAARAEYRAAVAELEHVDDPRAALPAFAFEHVSRMATTGDGALLKAAARIVGVTPPERSAPDRPPTVDGLRAEHDDGLDVALTAWARSGENSGPAEDQHLTAMIRMAEASRWPEAAARLGGTLTVGPTNHPSAGGPAGLLRLSESVVDGTIDRGAAITVAQALAVPPDTLACTCLFGISCRPVAAPNAVLLQLALETTRDDALAARLCGLLASYASVYGDQERALAFIETGIDRLAGGADESLLVHLVNEASVVLGHLGRPQAALERADDTIVRADRLGDVEYGDLGRRNRAWSLAALERLREAETQLVELDAAQTARGDQEAARITRLDLAGLRARGGDFEPIAADDEDPDAIFTNATALALGGDLDAAVEGFQRGFALLSDSEPYDRRAYRQRDFANVLWDAGHRGEAMEQMERAARWFDRAGRVADACEAYTRLAMALVTEPDVARAHARRAVAAGERIGPGKAMAEALTALGSVELAAFRPHDALEHLSRAAALDPSPEIVGTYVQALTACGRAAEAVEILEARLGDPDSLEPRLRAAWLAALGNTLADLGQREYALSALAAAYEVAQHLPAGVLTASIADAYAIKLSAAGYPARAATVLEEARAAVRGARFGDLEEVLMASLGSMLRGLGDLPSAERILTEVCERRRPRGRDRVLAQSLYALGSVTVSRGDHHAALDRLAEAQAVAEAAGDVNTQASALDTIGFAHSELGQPERAVEYHRRAATLHASVGSHDHEVMDRCGLVRALVLLGDAAAARSELDVVLELHERVPTGLAVGHIAAHVHALEGDWETANSLFRTALEGVTSAHPADTPAEARTRASLHDRVFREAASAAIAAGDAPSALAYTEARRARYQRAVIDRRGRRPPDVDASAWREYEDAADEVADVRTQRRSAGFASEAFDARYYRALERLEAASAAVFGSDDAAPGAEQLPHFDELVLAVPAGSAVVCASAGPEGLDVVRAGRSPDGAPWSDCRTHPGFTSADLELLLFGTEGWVAAWSESGEEPAYEALDALVKRVCATIEEHIWPALVEGLPADCQALLLMPGGALAALPVHAGALLDGAASPLGVQYTPSLRVLRPDRPEPGLHEGLLAQAVDPLGDLPFTRYEAATVAQRHVGPARPPLRGPEVTATRVLEMLRSADIVQFAGHAAFDAEDPLRSALFCAAGDGHAERLNVSAFLRETGAIRSRMVVLSACESGRVDANDPLDEHIGLAGVLVAVGARCVLAAQWPVDDLVAALVVIEFFARWDRGRRPAAVALAQAQTWLRDEVTVEHVRARLDEWAELAQGDESFEELRREWAAPMDPELRPFAAPLNWAPFHLVGAP